MALLDEGIVQELKQRFAQLDQPVTLLFFPDPAEQENTRVMRELLTEVAALSDKLSFEERPASEAAPYRIDYFPSLTLLDGAGQDTRMRFVGIPGGYEFGVLIEDILDVSKGQTRLSRQTLAKLEGLPRDVHIQVFTTPT